MNAKPQINTLLRRGRRRRIKARKQSSNFQPGTPKFQLLYSTILHSQMKISSKTEMGCGDSNSYSHMGFELKTLTQGPKNEKSKIKDRVRDIPVV
jgi:hypothetical protein